jgi:hypothetical protein
VKIQLSFVVERDRDGGDPQPEARQAAAIQVIEDAWRKAVSASPATQPGLMQWVGGAIVAYATLLGLDPERVRAELLERIPPPRRAQEPYGDGTFPFVVEPPDPNRPKRRQRVVPPEELDPVAGNEIPS